MATTRDHCEATSVPTPRTIDRPKRRRRHWQFHQGSSSQSLDAFCGCRQLAVYTPSAVEAGERRAVFLVARDGCRGRWLGDCAPSSASAFPDHRCCLRGTSGYRRDWTPFYGAAGDLQALGGHRAFTHSITFAVLLGFGASLMTLVDGRWAGYRSRLAVFVAVVTALHGVLDIFTSIGATTSPVQFFSPFLDARVRCLTASDQRAIQRTVSLLDPPRWLHASAVVRARHPVAASRISEPRQSRARSNGYAA